MIFGLFQKYVKPSSGLQLAVGIAMMIAMLAMGIAWPIYADADTWRVVVLVLWGHSLHSSAVRAAQSSPSYS